MMVNAQHGTGAMKDFLHAATFLLIDMASTVLFLLVYWATGSLTVSVVLGMALGLGQIGWELARRRPIDTMQWVSLVVIMASGTAALVTQDARFIMVKLSVIYGAIGVVMLKRGWMDRYLPPIAVQTVPDLGVAFGYIWAGLMFGSAVLNLALAFTLSFGQWAAFMSIWSTASKLVLFLIQYSTMKIVGRRRVMRGDVTLPDASVNDGRELA
jgi:intracellular septation protein